MVCAVSTLRFDARSTAGGGADAATALHVSPTLAVRVIQSLGTHGWSAAAFLSQHEQKERVSIALQVVRFM